MQGMSLSVNAVSEVREFTTTTGRTVYVLDGRADFDLDALIAACTSRACAPPPVGRGGSLPSGGGSRFSPRSGADPEPHARRRLAMLTSGDSKVGQGSVDAADREFRKRMPENPAVRSRIPLYALHGISTSGRFKNQHETGYSGIAYQPDSRMETEREQYGASVKSFPFYGYLTERGEHHPWGNDDWERYRGSEVAIYGGVIFEFKPRVNDRTTVTFGDSISPSLNAGEEWQMRRDGSPAPIPVNDVMSVTKERRAVAFGGYGYFIEAQVHDPLKVSDISRIYVQRGETLKTIKGTMIPLGSSSTTGTKYGSDIEKQIESVVQSGDYDEYPITDVLTEMFPGVEIVEVDPNDYAHFSSDETCEAHGEFACTSRACAPPPVGRGGSLPSGGSHAPLPNGADPEPFAAQLIKQWTSTGELESHLERSKLGWKQVPKDPVVRTRVTLSILESILSDDGVFRTQHETGRTHGGVFDPKKREHAEKRMFSASETRPKYGYLSERGQETTGKNLQYYGPIVIEFKDEVSDRTTFTVGDSLGNMMAAMRVSDIASSSDQRRVATAPYGERSYVEAQIHGDLTLKDVARIYITKDDFDRYTRPIPKDLPSILMTPKEPVLKTITQQYPDIEIVVVDVPRGERMMFSLCTEHGEFACTSRACAPPPVGTGGSLPTAVQHITSRKAAALIKSGGFLIGRGQMHGAMFGNGIYLSMAGDKWATELYRSGTRKEGEEAALVKGTVSLKNPLRVSGNSKEEVGKDIVKKLGGAEGVRAAATKSYERLMEGAKIALKKVLGEDAVDEVDWEDEFETDPVFNDMTSEQYARFTAAVEPYLPHGVVSFGSLSDIDVLRRMMSFDAKFVSSRLRSIGNLIADLGYDGIEITNPRFSAEVGGSQIVVFDPKAITVESVEDFGALIERFGVEVTLDYAPTVFACTEHGEFACTSKACAPPPVGTGGSLKSGSGAVERWTGGEATVAIAPKSKQFIALDDVHSTWPRHPTEVLKLLGNAEPYPDGYKISTEQDLSRFVVSSRWVKMGESVVPVLRKVAAEVIKDGIDRAASAENMEGESAEVNVVRLHVARVLTAIRSAPKSTVWRGLRVSQEVLDQLKVGSVYSEVLATATGRRKLAENFSRGKFGSVGQKRSGTVQVLLKMNARNLPIGGNPTGNLVDLADERFISGKFRVVSVSKVRSTHIIEVEQIDGD